MKYKVEIKGLDTPDDTVSIRALKELIDLVLDCSERGQRLAVQGESVKRRKLVLDWRAKQQARAAVRLAIQHSLEAPPRAYSRPGDEGNSRYSLEDLKINFRELLQPTS